MVGSVIGGLLACLIGTGSIFELDFLGVVFALIASSYSSARPRP